MAKQQIRLVKRELSFLESDVINLRVVNLFGGVTATSAPKWKTRALYTVGACSLALSMVPFVWKKYPFQSTVSVALYCCVLVCAACYFVALVASFNHKLLREVVFSFGSCFLSLQFSAIRLCVCDLFYWDAWCFNAYYA